MQYDIHTPKKDNSVENVSERAAAWKIAAEIVDPIINKYGLETYSTGPNIFSTTAIKTTNVDQHIDHTMRVADWLLAE